VAPIVFLIVFGSLEFGRAMMVVHGLEAAARDACRVAITPGATQTEVNSAASNRLGSFGISGHTMTLTPALGTAEQWAMVTVRITVPYNSVSWLPAARFMTGRTLSGVCTLPNEAKPAS
jgi:Flp pilus assembly protein TadG